MSSSTHPTTPRGTPDPAAGERDGVVESLLVAGLDAYFKGDYEGAIHTWTRVLFVDRGHARARAYIERARAVLAERQRKADELVHSGLAAFEEGDARRARELLSSALEGGSSDEVALAMMHRLERLGPSGWRDAVPDQGRAPADSRGTGSAAPVEQWGLSRWIIGSVGVLLLAAALLAVGWNQWASWTPAAPAAAPSASVPAREVRLPLPRSSDLIIRQAQALYVRGHLHEALEALGRVRPDDPRRAESDVLRGEIQRALLAQVDATVREIQP